jgi:hypothetical protein
MESGSSVGKSSSKLGGLTQSIGITESLVSPTDQNFVVKLLNNSGSTITISNVKIGDLNVNFSEDLAQSGSKLFKVNTSEVCELGKVVSEDVTITYVTENGLTKTFVYPSQVLFDCSPYNIAQANLANPCSSCPDPVELHSGQITSYDVGALDDKEQDGTAKSYTDNGDGTVTDNHTSLVWMKNHKLEGGTCDANTWEDALSYCSTLADGVDGLSDGSVAGDWRVPSSLELFTLPDMSYPSSSYLNSVFTQTGWGSVCWGYWSSTTLPAPLFDFNFAYSLYSYYGNISYDSKTVGSPYGVRCVRSGS